MCTHNISLDEHLVERVRPALGKGVELQVWLQHQLELMLLQTASKVETTSMTSRNLFDDEYMSRLIKQSASAWRDVKDADAWIHVLRGE